MTVSSIFLCDFDGTISLKDVTDTLIEHFGQAGCDELEAAWEAGMIGSLECMKGQIALLKADTAALNACLDTIAIDPTFVDFLQAMATAEVPVAIVSDGLDYAIDYILQRHGITNVPIIANHLVYDGDEAWHLEFPYATTFCKKQSGNCKCHQADILYQTYDQVLYVGDGTSDFCVSHVIDFVYAKGKLIHYCDKHGLPHHAITEFADILPHVAPLLK
ncbi:phosphatase [Wohlfahrtiimonas chitiniclastica]|uniref:MtnX-like HAD-IB family phosphatase n=1 Tax=Wohlfahrtiimonas chitiniclastica TaxID=400946 RepID=UPI000B994AF9|nr:MtnX-like HAD-IB family phosphatase [Wohlfahrtiimonas chitiniclastica]OYQ87815.1 phosphatase [Wohlfahrtiimonas chitiniclastica]OYQ88141.1 phosphatase [Wohlfahrtiimonas chitiniclastica]